MMNCQEALAFSETHSQKRIARASEVFGRPVVLRLIGFVLFLLGAKREEIAERLDMPLGTFLSLLTRLHRVGLDGFRDRRAGRALSAPEVPRLGLVTGEEDALAVVVPANKRLLLPREDSLQCRVVLLNLLENGMVSATAVASTLGLSDRHLRL